MPNATVTETAVQFQNATSGFADSTGLAWPLVFLIYALAMLSAANFVAPWLARSTMLSSVAGGFVRALVYAIKGLATTAVLVVVGAPLWFVATMDAGARTMAFRYAGYAVAGFGALVVIGWLADQAVKRFIDAHPDIDEWADIFPESPDEDDETPEVAD